ncbi:MAG: ABC transporter permease [Alphaproteobacteria bacterium]|jgi:phospholipid/cholesterol/gamma-HCH transport system permease protein|nr:ABC transporter permease [Alphaproteobacteria bacterium]
MAVTEPIGAVGRGAAGFLARIGRSAAFAGRAVGAAVTPPFFPGQLARQAVEIGYFSLPVVALTALFTGMVLALQSHTGFARMNAEGAVATIVAISITRELAPVLAGLMVAGRVGAAMAAELGTMRVTEQIDALRTLSVDPFRYLIAPRVLAATAMLPLLVLVGDIIGLWGGFLVGVYDLGFGSGSFVTQMWDALERMDVISGLVKAAVFGFLVAVLGCFHGYHAAGGAQGVGTATMNAVVSASILILLANYLLTQVLFS